MPARPTLASSRPTPGPSRRTPRTPRSPRSALASAGVVLALLLTGLALGAAPASAVVVLPGADAAAWPTAWRTYTHSGGAVISDVNDDMNPSLLSIASGACSGTGCAGTAPSVLFATDGTNAFFRVRMAADNADAGKGGLTNGAFLVQLADTAGAVKVVVGVDGKSASLDYVYVADAVGGTVQHVYDFPFTDGTPSSNGMRWIPSEDGTSQYFLDFQVPMSAIQTISQGAITPSTRIKMYYGSSAAANLATINKDFMLGNVSAVDFSSLDVVALDPAFHEVSFDANDGTTPLTTQQVEEGEHATEPTTPTREGYTFAGWHTDPTGGQPWTFGTDTVTGATTLYAHWTAVDPEPDTDRDDDGLSDVTETELGTDPLDADSDDDGVEDGVEVSGALNVHAGCATDPRDADSDGDRLGDGRELRGITMRAVLVTRQARGPLGLVAPDPCTKDTDEDGLSDQREVRGVLDLRTGLMLRSSPVVADTDGDELSDLVEVQGTANVAFGNEATHPLRWDTDRGGVSDAREISFGSNPNDRRSGPRHP